MTVPPPPGDNERDEERWPEGPPPPVPGDRPPADPPRTLSSSTPPPLPPPPPHGPPPPPPPPQPPGVNPGPPHHPNLPSTTPPGDPFASYAGPPRAPGKVSAIGGMMLGAGIWSVILALLIAMGTVCLWLPWIFQLVVGVMAIINGASVLGANKAAPSRGLAICLIICILNCDVITMTLGILSLVFINDNEVQNYYAERGVTY